MSIAAHDGPHGHFSRGSIKLRPFPMSPWVLSRGEQLCCASWSMELCKGSSLLHWSILFHWPGWQWGPWSQGALKRTFLPSIHSRSLIQVVSLGHPLIQTTACHFKGRKLFLWEENLLFTAPGSSLKTMMQVILSFDFAYGELERLWRFFAYNAPWQRKLFNITVRPICCACAKSSLGN